MKIADLADPRGNSTPLDGGAVASVSRHLAIARIKSG